jgi:hypothetical protein
MKIGDEDPFMDLMGRAFSPADLRRMSLSVSPYTIEPMQPGRNELLAHFDGLLEQLLLAREQKVKRAKIETFLGNLAGLIEVSPGEPLWVKRPMSYKTRFSDGEYGWGVLRGDDAVLRGDFGGMVVDEWFDIPLGIEEPEEDELELYRREQGLLVVIANPELAFEDGDVLPLEGLTGVPLNHGMPELYRVLR